jgi:arylsulfatase A-like enzyme
MKSQRSPFGIRHEACQQRRSLLLASVAFAAATWFPNPARAVARPQPNIVFILADDLGYADLSCYGRRDYRTPAIDMLAADGVRFTHGYANSAVCSATRVGLITGRYQNRLAVGLEEPLVSAGPGLPPTHPTLPSLLRQAGYVTSLIGKWHLGALPDFGPKQSGYDHFWGIRGGGVDYFTHRAKGAPDLWDNEQPVEQAGYLTNLIGDKAVAFIERQAASARPFFASVHFTAPHWPWEGPNDGVEAERLSRSASPTALAHHDGGSLKTYAEMVTRMDHQVGRLLGVIKRLGLEDDTIIVFTSDNGGERFSDTWPFSGKKTQLLEGGIRIPAIVRWPGKIPAGVVSDQVMISMDWLPTLLAAAGAAHDPAYPPDGINLLDILTGQPAVQRTLCWRYLNMHQQACRRGDWKYLKILGNSFLFNVVADPLERANLKGRYPDKYKELKSAFDSWNAAMLPLNPDARTGGFTGKDMADQFGTVLPRNVPPSTPD